MLIKKSSDLGIMILKISLSCYSSVYYYFWIPLRPISIDEKSNGLNIILKNYDVAKEIKWSQDHYVQMILLLPDLAIFVFSLLMKRSDGLRSMIFKWVFVVKTKQNKNYMLLLIKNYVKFMGPPHTALGVN